MRDFVTADSGAQALACDFYLEPIAKANGFQEAASSIDEQLVHHKRNSKIISADL